MKKMLPELHCEGSSAVILTVRARERAGRMLALQSKRFRMTAGGIPAGSSLLGKLPDCRQLLRQIIMHERDAEFTQDVDHLIQIDIQELGALT